MRFKGTIIAFFILLILGGVVYWFEIREERTRVGSREDRVLSLDFLSVDSITIERKGGRVRLERKGPEEWEITEPIRTEADNGAVKSLSNRLQNLEYRRVVDENPEDLTKYGLADPEIRVEIRGGGKEETLEIGNRGPIGASLYLKKKSEPRVLLVDSGLKSVVNKGLFDLRERRIIRFERNQVEEIHLTYPDREIKLVKKDLKWRIQKPADYPADENEVNRILTELINLKADEFVVEKAEDLSQYGLDHPQLEVALKLREKEELATLRIGRKAARGIYAYRLGGDPVYLTNPEILGKLTKRIPELRDKTVVKFDRNQVTALEFARPATATVRIEREEDGKWKLTYPYTKKVDRFKLGSIFSELRRARVKEFVADHPEDLQVYGLEDPRLKVTLFGAGNKPLASLLVGKEAAGNLSFAKTEAEPVYKIESARVRAIQKKLKEILSSK